jgi:MauM/NapG family ferredoxin protein
MRFQRVLQIPLFLLFLVLLWLAAYPLPSWLEVDLFLRLDPLISLGAMATARAYIPRVAWVLLILGVSLILGRLFCGYICPMGATIDFVDWLRRKKRKQSTPENSFEVSGQHRNLKYLFLAGIGGTSLLGISSDFLFSPLSLITRFYSFVIYPMVIMILNLFLQAFSPLFPAIKLEELSFIRFSEPRFNTNLFVACLVLAIFLLGVIRPRFWCRNLCPSGAILALFSLRPLFRRRVSEKCNECGKCLRVCPMGAIGKDIVTTAHTECVACLQCQEVCPEKAISFEIMTKAAVPVPEIDLSRRKLLSAGVTGMAAAALTMTNLKHLHGGETPRALRSSQLIRPPGALPEPAFQARCVRCGECVKACLTNTLQPVWFEAGLSGIWSPKITARLGGCEQNCNLCGLVCPTGAIRFLSMEEKLYAKIGTARIEKSRCIAWEQDRQCLICDEICPYNAITSQLADGHRVTVPVVDENRCNGCGYCESKCPIAGDSAIMVEPLGELRLASGSYQEKAREFGLVFQAKTSLLEHSILDVQQVDKNASTRTPRGESKGKEISLPPGFIAE